MFISDYGQEECCMNILLITELFSLPDDPVLNHAVWRGTTAVSSLVRHWTKEHNVVCIREVTVGMDRRVRFYMDKLLGRDNPLNYVPDQYLIDGVSVYTINWEYTHFYQLTNGRLNHYMGHRINHILRKISFVPDVIISHMPSFSVAYYIREIASDAPRIAVLHRGDLDYLFAQVGIIHGRKISQSRLKVFNNAFDCVYSRNKNIYQKAAELKIKNLSTGIVMSGIDKLVIDTQRQWKGFSTRKIRILYAGALIEQKGIQYIIRALSLLNDEIQYEFEILGEGEYRNSLLALSDECCLRERVKFLGQKDRVEVIHHMQEADIFIMPSYHETLGLVYLEAMSVGCITVGSKGEGIDGIIIDGENGFLVDPHSVEGIVEIFQRIIGLSEDELERVSNAALSTADFYSEDNMAQKYMDLVKRVIKEKNQK